MAKQTTPAGIDDTVRDFLDTVPVVSANYIPVRPERWAKEGYCQFNSELKVERDGGEVVWGWVIWYEAGHLIEAERHCVWKSSSGDLVDITQKSGGEQQILFKVESGHFSPESLLPPNLIKSLSQKGNTTRIRAHLDYQKKKNYWKQIRAADERVEADIRIAAETGGPAPPDREVTVNVESPDLDNSPRARAERRKQKRKRQQ